MKSCADGRRAMRVTRLRRRRRARSEEGAVMLIVLLILLTATALASTSLQTTQFELRSAGYNRAAIQMQYVSSAAAATTMAWVDATAMDRTFLRYLAAWDAYGVPDMTVFGEPPVLPANRAMANRTQWIQQRALSPVSIAPITNPGWTEGTATDPIGTFGPRFSYLVGQQDTSTATPTTDYLVDMYDCRMLPNTAAVGFQVNQGGSGTMKQFQYYCVVTSRGRAYVPYPTSGSGNLTKQWTLSAPAGTYVVNRFTMSHDARGTIVTPPI